MLWVEICPNVAFMGAKALRSHETDRNANGGGLLVYIRSDLACDRKIKLECKSIES
jgi:hypothetical protein